MPIVKNIVQNVNTRILVWEVSEPLEHLLNPLNLSSERLLKYNALSQKRKREFLGIRSCMKELNLEQTILYTENGKPYIPINKQISFTHSYGMVAVGVSDLDIGIDIELKRTEKITNIQHKFVRPDEAVFLPTDKKSEYLHIIWGIKEGLYKLNGGNLWNFLHHYKVEPFELKENQPIVCWVLEEGKSNKYHAFYQKINEYYLIWTVDIED